MNYRHAFHAGNFADLVKHAALLDVLARLEPASAPLTVVDTHAGRGVYDLSGPEARKSGEAEAGIARLMAADDAPAVFEPLQTAVVDLNKGGALKLYPGSPWLIARALRPQDRYVACELRADEHAALRRELSGKRGVQTLCADGYEVARSQAGTASRLLVLIDPPFERDDDYARVVETCATIRRRKPDAILLVWLPLKDLATFDSFLGDFEDAVGGPGVAVETRMRPLSDPMKMNGCALVLANGPAGAEDALLEAARWTTASLGQGGSARLHRF